MGDEHVELENLQTEIRSLRGELAETKRETAQLWTLFRVYMLGADGHKIGKLKVSKKTIAGLLFSIAIGVINFLLRLFDVI